jgi:hypothetical protein
MIRELFSLDEMKIILNRYDASTIEISNHYLNYLSDGKRDISKMEIINLLLKKSFYFVEKQINFWTRYKIVYELSNKYDLIIVVKEEPKILKVVSSYKTNRKLKEKWKKISKYHMMK